jgi:hypothetical protein
VEVTVGENNVITFLKVLGGGIIHEEIEDSPPSAYSESEKRKIRSMAVAYAKDLVVAEKTEATNLIPVAENIFRYIWG